MSVVAETGGMPEAVVTIDRSQDQLRIHWPQYLPDGKRFVYVVMKKTGSRLAIAERGVTPREIGDAASTLAWIDPDILLHTREGVLFGQRMDLDRGVLVGEPFTIAEGLGHFATTQRAMVAASRNGHIAYHAGVDLSRLTWFDRSGRVERVVGEPGGYQNARLSHDDTRVLFDRGGLASGFDIWIADLERSVETRVTSDTGVEVTAVFAPGDRDIVYGSNRGGPPHLHKRDLATGAEVELRPPGRQQQAWDVSATGMLGFNERSENGNFEAYVMPLDRPGEARRLEPPNRFINVGVWFSPDGRHYAFTSNRSGRFETYVAEVDQPTSVVTVSHQGGIGIRWSRDGREVFYVAADRSLMAVPIQTSPALRLGTPRKLFDFPGAGWVDFEPSADGRFLAIVPTQVGNAQPITMILNWRPPA